MRGRRVRTDAAKARLELGVVEGSGPVAVKVVKGLVPVLEVRLGDTRRVLGLDLLVQVELVPLRELWIAGPSNQEPGHGQSQGLLSLGKSRVASAYLEQSVVHLGDRDGGVLGVLVVDHTGRLQLGR